MEVKLISFLTNPNGYPHLEHKKKRLVKPCFKSLKQHL